MTPKHDDTGAPQVLTVGIFLDNWKLPTFKRVLTEAGIKFTKHPGVTPDTCSLRVKTSNPLALKPILEKCQKEARKHAR